MDPQKNPSNPAAPSDGQLPPNTPDDNQPAAVPSPGSQEVTVDFSQGPAAAPTDTLPTNAPQAAGMADPANPTAVPGTDPLTGMPPVAGVQQPGQPQDPFASPQPGQPSAMPPAGEGFGGAPAPSPDGSQAGYGAPMQPGQPGPQPFGAPDPSAGFDPQQSAVPPVAPAVPAKANEKKTVLVLAGVAVLLIAAIIVLVVL